VAELLVSDRPLQAGEPDPLEFNAVAFGLSRFLRNENTQPPLTIAITGEWGTGKSSLMNLLQADLKRYGFRPVWFNAWYHQKSASAFAI
jgi:predicted KAP-like P-loop ATPase